MRLSTERLVLRDYVEGDWRFLFAFESRAEVARFQSYDVKDKAECQRYVREVLEASRQVPRQLYDLAICRRDDEAHPIGRVGLQVTATREAMLWFVCHPAEWGSGIATESATRLLELAFDELRLHRVYADVDPRNRASARVLEKLGMRLEAQFRENVHLKGEWCDSAIYALLEREWLDLGSPRR